MHIDDIRAMFQDIYEYLCLKLDCPILPIYLGFDVHNRFFIGKNLHSNALVFYSSGFPKIAINESKLYDGDIFDICQTLAHESLHAILWTLKEDHSDNSDNFKLKAREFGIRLNDDINDKNLFDYRQVIKEI